jgi:phosphocarrier protein FPr
MEQAVTGIAAGKSAAFAWREACLTHARKLEALKNELLAARANDVRDVGRRVLRLLLDAVPAEKEYPLDSILVAEDLTPSETATLDRSRILGFCTTTGGASSHVAILARSLGIPAVAGIDPAALDVPDGTSVVLDGTKGWLRLNPSGDEMTRLRRRQEKLSSQRRGDLAMALRPATTRDGHHIEVAANISNVKEVEAATTYGADGVGLLRTEFLFMDRTTAPTEDEQTEVYRSIAAKLGKERPLIIRTLDVGGDKPLSYLPISSEANPFLGERGIRAMLARPGLLRTQLRAILRASAAGDVRIMFPMVGLLEEWREARAILEEERQKLDLPAIPVGIMVEVPSAAVLAGQFAREVDFFSIGTNDLTQYALAVDRGHPGLASKCDSLSPSILHLIDQTVRGAAGNRKWVGVCGGIAGDATAIPFLVGLGVQELSVSVPALPAVKALVRRLRLSDCKTLVEKALTMGTAADVRGLLPADEE